MKYTESYLAHHGIKGQKWGVRRYQNADGSLTAAGRRRQERQEIKASKKKAKHYEKAINKSQDRIRRLAGAGTNYILERNAAHQKSEQYLSKASFAKTDRKREKYMQKAYNFAKNAEINDKKASQVIKDVSKEEKKAKAIIEKMKNDKAVTYRTVYAESSAYADRAYTKGLNKTYGKTKYAGSYQVTNVSSNNYKVRGAKTRAGKSKKFNDDQYKQERDTSLIRREYYYY